MGIDLLEKPIATPEADKPNTGIHSDEPIDYAAAAERYAVEAQDPTLSPLEKQAKEDIVAFAAERAKQLAEPAQPASTEATSTPVESAPKTPENS
jgi:hypothetical protein